MPPGKKEPPQTGLLTIRCWNCGKMIERQPCSKDANGGTLHELCKPCGAFLEGDMEEFKRRGRREAK